MNPTHFIHPLGNFAAGNVCKTNRGILLGLQSLTIYHYTPFIIFRLDLSRHFVPIAYGARGVVGGDDFRGRAYNSSPMSFFSVFFFPCSFAHICQCKTNDGILNGFFNFSVSPMFAHVSHYKTNLGSIIFIFPILLKRNVSCWAQRQAPANMSANHGAIIGTLSVVYLCPSLQGWGQSLGMLRHFFCRRWCGIYPTLLTFSH